MAGEAVLAARAVKMAVLLSVVVMSAYAPGGASTTTSDAEPGWPFIRGPNYDGRSDERGLAESWPDEGPPVLWTRPLGQGYSAFVAWDDRVATQYQTLGGQYLVCLEADSGETVWQRRYGLPYEPVGVYPGPRASPTYAGGRLFFVSPRGVVECVDAGSGRQRWSVDLEARFGIRGADFGYSCSPTVVDGKVVLPVGAPGASLVALETEDGSVVWQAGDDPASYTPAYPITFGGRRLVLGYLQNALVCHDLQTGQRLWRRSLSSGYDEHSAWPLYEEPYLWISGPFRSGSSLLRLTGDAEASVAPVRTSRVMSNDIFSSVLHEGTIYGFDLRDVQAKTHRPSRGQFRSIDFLSGEENWSTGAAKSRRGGDQGENGPHVGHATVIVADDKLILLNDTGELILARATPARYVELGRVTVLGGEIGWTQPALHRGRLFVRNQSRAACVYLRPPSRMPEHLRSRAVQASEIPQSAYVDVAERLLGVEPEYAFDIPTPEVFGRWFAVTWAGILGGVALSLAALRLTIARQVSDGRLRGTYWCLAFVLGAAGTTLLSRWFDIFLFTWPVCLYVAFEVLVWAAGSRKQGRAARLRAWLVVAGFAIVCVTYFLLCRRLSLVTEWAFLCGFVAAVPFCVAGRYLFAARRWRLLWQWAASGAGYAAFYWFAVGVLWLRG